MILQNLKTGTSALITKYNTTFHQVVITYDCGGESQGSTETILDILEKHNIKATFFLTGQWIEKYPLLAKRIAEENHEIGNHSYSHPDFTQLTEEEMIKEVSQTEEMIKKVTGIDPKPIIRLPYGAFNDKVLQVVGSIGYLYSIQWSIDPRDWELPPADNIANIILDNITNGDIILLHNHGVSTALASDIFIPRLKEQNYEFMTVGNMITEYR
ncbi:MAG: polysaccharide deacetylase family protein [Aminipila sp.]